MITFQFNHICTHNIFIKSLLSFDETCPKAFVVPHNHMCSSATPTTYSSFKRSCIVIIFMEYDNLFDSFEMFLDSIDLHIRKSCCANEQRGIECSQRMHIHTHQPLYRWAQWLIHTHDARCFIIIYIVQEQPINCVAKSPFVLAAK